jgi:hypothetical protein
MVRGLSSNDQDGGELLGYCGALGAITGGGHSSGGIADSYLKVILNNAQATEEQKVEAYLKAKGEVTK